MRNNVLILMIRHDTKYRGYKRKPKTAFFFFMILCNGYFVQKKGIEGGNIGNATTEEVIIYTTRFET